ncbi:MAG: histidine phosphatase family protein [Bacillota bacterium]|nr:histidine phosphatase family protein [Bacillota bacterium]
MIRITLMRHGKTIWNQERRIQGQLDSELLPESKIQAIERGAALAANRFYRVYASTSSRAYQTAEYVLQGAEQNLSILRDPRLQEMHMGQMQGLLADEARAQFPQHFEDLIHRPARYVPVGDGEAFADVFHRVRDFLNTEIRPIVPAGGEPSEILIVSHGATIKVFEAVLDGVNLENFVEGRVISNLECIRYDFDGTRYIKREFA